MIFDGRFCRCRRDGIWQLHMRQNRNAFLWAMQSLWDFWVKEISNTFLCIFRYPCTRTYPGPLGPGPRFQELGTLLGHHGRDGATWGILGIVVIILTGRLQIWIQLEFWSVSHMRSWLCAGICMRSKFWRDLWMRSRFLRVLRMRRRSFLVFTHAK